MPNGGNREVDIFVMGIVTKDEVCKRLNAQIKGNYANLSWIGVKMETVSSIESVSVNINDDSFYSGSGDYYFSGTLSFMLNTVFDDNKPIGCDLRRFAITPSCKINIQEINNDFEINIIEAIHVVPHY